MANIKESIPHIIVEVKDGMVQNVYSDMSVDVEVADLDVEDDLDLLVALDMLEKVKKPGWKLVW